MKIGQLKKVYPIADRIPEVKKMARSCLFPALLSSAVPKKNRTSILKKRCHNPVCRKIYVTSVQGLARKELGSTEKRSYRDSLNSEPRSGELFPEGKRLYTGK